MRSSTIILGLLATLTAAQVDSLPTCAQNCATNLLANGTSKCGTDPKCICSDSTFLNTIACCLVSVCSAADQTSAIAYAQQICQAQGVSVPTAVSCNSALLASSTSAAASSAASTGVVTSSSASMASTTASSSASGTSAASTMAASSSTSKAWAPKQTAMVGVEIVGGLVAGWALL